MIGEELDDVVDRGDERRIGLAQQSVAADRGRTRDGAGHGAQRSTERQRVGSGVRGSGPAACLDDDGRRREGADDAVALTQTELDG